jgi:thiol:disulfide interchange protein DsbA
MKHIKFVIAAALVLVFAVTACSREPAEPTAADTATIEEEAAADTSAQAKAPEPAIDEPVELVEESSAEAVEESPDKPLLLAQAEPVSARHDWKFKEGTNFVRLVPTQPTVGGADKIEVAEFFWYGCPHCFDFEPQINRWAKEKPANVRFVQIPATWNPLVMLHAQLYYTEQVLADNGKIANPAAFRDAVFKEYHQRGNRMTTEAAIQNVFTQQGVSAEDFSNTWKSFEVAQKLRVAKDLARRYTITGVPEIVVNGKYRTGAAEAGGYPKLIEVRNELVERETLR